MSEVNARNTSFDFLRALAAFMVVSTHTTVYYWNECVLGDLNFFVYTIFNCFGRSSVPIFFMISGAFLLQKEVSINNLLKKSGKLLLIYFVWLAGYAFFDMEGNILQFDISNWLDCVINEKYHLWFIPVMICIYLMVPILQAFVHYKDGLYVPYWLTLFFLATICRSTLLLLFPNAKVLNYFLGKVSVELCEYTGYFILGYYLLVLSPRKIKKEQASILLGLNLIIAIIVTFGISWHKGFITNVFASSFSAPVFFQAVFLFILFRDLKLSSNKHATLSKISKAFSSWGMGIYLLHPFIIEHLDGWFGINTKMFTAIIAVPLAIIIYFTVTTVMVIIMKKIPILRHLC